MHTTVPSHSTPPAPAEDDDTRYASDRPLCRPEPRDSKRPTRPSGAAPGSHRLPALALATPPLPTRVDPPKGDYGLELESVMPPPALETDDGAVPVAKSTHLGAIRPTPDTAPNWDGPPPLNLSEEEGDDS